MSFLEVFGFARQALSGHRRRTLLSLCGMAIGIAAVILLTALGEGARRYMMEQFATLGSNLLIVFPGKTETTGISPGNFGTTHDLTLKDAETVQHSLAGLRRLAPLTVGNDTVAYQDRRRQVAVLGSTSDFLEVRNLSISTGEFLPPGPMDRGAPVVVIGQKVAEELYPGVNPLGTIMRIGDFRMRVIGVLGPRGMHMGIDMNEVVIVPVATAMRMFNQSSLFRLLIKMNAFGDIDTARTQVLAILKERHNGEEDVTCWTQDSVMTSLSAILTVLTYALAGIAAISLTVAGIGIMNVMLVSVSERTREIGLLKAIGARNAQIRGLFLAEAILLSATGGAVGLAIGSIGVGVFDAVFPSFPAAPPQWAILAAIGVSVGVGGVFGLLPAWKATRLDPVSALARR